MSTTGYKKFLVLISVIILIGGVYLYFSKNDKLEAAVSSSNSLTSSLDSSNTSNTSSTNSIDVSFLSSLSSLMRIKIDASLFSDKSFISLKDNNIEIAQVTPGRPNPFAPTESNSFSSDNSSVITNEPSQVTTNSAILSGSVNNTIKAQSVYFEYGTTPALGKLTANAEQSLIGTFVMNISQLTPKTTYYYRAVAKVNSVALYGEVVLFTTN